MGFLVDLTFAVELIALGLGVGFLIWGYRNEGKCVGVAKIFGYIITICALIAISFTTCYGISYWIEGYFNLPTLPTQMMK